MAVHSINILLIEDSDDDAFFLKRDLARALKVPYTLSRANDLAAGLEFLKSSEFNIVLLDLGLPDGSGLSTFNIVQKNAPDMPVIVLTGHDDDDLAVEAVQKGAQDYLVKGKVENGLLGRSIRYAIERQKLLTQLKQSRKEINTLRGFLPICANCKKIRDDQGYWTRIETYISLHSEAEFSHGICPECAFKLYGRKVEPKE